jgi:hypothetical protein
MGTGNSSVVRCSGAILRNSPNPVRIAIFMVTCLIVLAATALPAWAEPTCRNGVSATYQFGGSVIERAGQKANEEVLDRLHENIPSAPPIDLNRPEHAVKLNYNLRLNDSLLLRLYGGAAITPEDEVYDTTGDGVYKVDGFPEPVPIGPVKAEIKTEVSTYMLGADFLWQTGDCASTNVHLVGGFGLEAFRFFGSMSGDFDAQITGPGSDLTLGGRFQGYGAHASVMSGLGLNIETYGDLMVLGGFRGGMGYGTFESDVFDKDGAFPVFGPYLQVTGGFNFF